MERDNTQPTDKQEVEMTKREEAVVDDIWADSFWNSVQEKHKLNQERERERKGGNTKIIGWMLHAWLINNVCVCAHRQTQKNANAKCPLNTTVVPKSKRVYNQLDISVMTYFRRCKYGSGQIRNNVYTHYIKGII